MDCAIVTDWIGRMGCRLNNTHVDEWAGLTFLGVACLAGLFIIGMAFRDGVIRPWRASTPDTQSLLDVDAGKE